MKESKILSEESLVEINGFKVYTKLYGKNREKPTVVMDSGYGEYSKTWDNIISELVKLANVFVYDRPGLGKSEKSPIQRTSLNMVKELSEILIKLKIKPPYVLVGHSFGGVNARLFAAQFPNDVAGLVLIDSTPEDYKERLLPTMSKEFQEAYNKSFIYEGTYDEFMESLNQLKKSQRHFDIPLIILSAGKKAHYSKESQELWNEMQKELLAISKKSELIIAKNSAHYIHNYEPLIVVDAVKRLVNNFGW